MNHRTGKLTAADFEPARALPAPTFDVVQVEHTSDFGVLDAGATFKEPAPQRDILSVEAEHPWLVLVYFGALFGAVLVCHWIAGGFGMSTVFLDGPTNSTLFTSCCEVAIGDDQENCPVCKQQVLPLGRTARWERAYGPIRRGTGGYGNPRTNDKREEPALSAWKARRA